MAVEWPAERTSIEGTIETGRHARSRAHVARTKRVSPTTDVTAEAAGVHATAAEVASAAKMAGAMPTTALGPYGHAQQQRKRRN